MAIMVQVRAARGPLCGRRGAGWSGGSHPRPPHTSAHTHTHTLHTPAHALSSAWSPGSRGRCCRPPLPHAALRADPFRPTLPQKPGNRSPQRATPFAFVEMVGRLWVAWRVLAHFTVACLQGRKNMQGAAPHSDLPCSLRVVFCPTWMVATGAGGVVFFFSRTYFGLPLPTAASASVCFF